jgi:hypothetical protein
MPYTPIQSMFRFEFDLLYKQAAKGNDAALDMLDTLWSDYTDIFCFICDKPTGEKPKTQALPERPDYDARKVILVPICADCWALPQLERLNKCLMIMKAMFARRGRQVHFNFAPKRQPHPR